jgi:hypothetical protein
MNAAPRKRNKTASVLTPNLEASRQPASTAAGQARKLATLVRAGSTVRPGPTAPRDVARGAIVSPASIVVPKVEHKPSANPSRLASIKKRVETLAKATEDASNQRHNPSV